MARGTFRVNRKKVGLTYSCPTNLDENPIESVNELLEFLEMKHGHCQYVIAKELHESGKKHYHVYVNYDITLDIADPLYFDFKGVHPNILKPGQGWIAYCKKDKEYITNMAENIFKRALDEPDADHAIELLWKDAAPIMVQHADKIEGNLRKRMRPTPKVISYTGPYRLPYLTDIKSTVIVGESGLGKSYFAKSMFHFKKPLFVSHLDDLKKFNGSYDGIIFDDMSFTHLPRTTQIHILDWDDERSIHVRYGVACIPAQTPKIFTCNEMCFDMSDAAIARRVTLVEY